MRVAALYDIHGNLSALEAVVAALEREDGVREIIVGGDVLWGPHQSECLALLRDVGATFVAGNCERDVLASVDDVSAWCNARLSAEERAFVASWPARVERDLDGLGRVLFCHAVPNDVDGIMTRITPDAVVASTLADIDASVVVCGHTHVQFDRRVAGAPRLVNAGSVGLPYESAPGARWAGLGPDIDLRRTEYDIAPAIARLEAVRFPGATGSSWFDEIFVRSLEGRVGPEEATAEFERRRGA